jgi:hypothetical protein
MYYYHRAFCSSKSSCHTYSILSCTAFHVRIKCLVTRHGSLYITTTDSVNRYDASGALIKSLWPMSDGDDIPSDDIGGLAVKDKGTLTLSVGNMAHMVEHSSASSPTKFVQTLPAHPNSNPIHALLLSYDCSLLTVASPNAVVGHNLPLGAQTTLCKFRGVWRCAGFAFTRVFACSWA